MTRWLVTGAGGQLGHALLRVLGEHGAEVTGLDRAALDLTDAVAVSTALREHSPDVVVNAAAYTAVDAAEQAVEEARLGNEVAPGVLAAACALHGPRLLHVSTDYVFPGDGDRPYAEDAPTGPRSVYGRTKLAGEQAVLAAMAGAYVVRTAWVYGVPGTSFPRTIARLARERETIEVVDDQRGSPTWADDLARGLVALGGSGAPAGVYHLTDRGETTWYGFAVALFEELGLDPARVRPTTTAAFPRPAPRPAYSVLGQARWDAAGLPAPPQWRDALRTALAQGLLAEDERGLG